MSELAGELILYRADDGGSVVQLRAVGGTVWLTQAQMADLYGTSAQNVQQTIARVLADGEVDESTVNSELMVRTEGTRQVRRELKIYNLDMVLAVGYRVTTARAVQFRQWATTVLTEYLVKGFALQDERLKDPGADYFDELLERIRDIRASEKRFYLKVRDLFATTSADYDGTSDLARTFFATIQNKLLHAVTGRTAGELIRERCDPASGTLGLTTWKGDRPRKTDASVAKNYLTEAEVSDLNLLTTQFLDFAEGRARRRQTTSMADWVAQTDRFVEFQEYPVLTGAGSVAHSHVEQIVAERYAEWDAQRRELESQRAAADEISDLDALLEAERHLTQGEPGDGHQPE
ncbi:RhuM family protein [Cellulomonas citrea]|uniref:RhuM family protein n=1 Tax=Cellulomonas citrea TaxID=1909423 RepID=UPI00135B610B|nr:RhuM family protein [Cellulomonas citrea]